jgi:hypothetical protein
MTLEPTRQNRFTDPSQTSGVEAGFRDAVQNDTINKKFIRRNIRPYKTLRRFSKKGGLRKLRNKNMQQLESFAARAVLSKAKVKTKKLDTTVNRGKGKGQHRPQSLRRARRILARTPNAHAPGALPKIQNKRVRRATIHLRQIRRNRRVMKQPKYSAQAYDIWKGYRR